MRFRAGTAPGCLPLVRPNWQYFNKALPGSAPQLIVVNANAQCFDKTPDPTVRNTPGGGCAANRQLIHALDRQAVLDWLR
jgi:hypothetical protein